jgi:hypothetical protein
LNGRPAVYVSNNPTSDNLTPQETLFGMKMSVMTTSGKVHDSRRGEYGGTGIGDSGPYSEHEDGPVSLDMIWYYL